MQSKSEIKSIDLSKTTFHLIALGIRSQVIIRKKFSRSQLLEYTANLPSSLIGMEAGVGSHFLGRALREQGHEVRLIPAQFVRPFVKSNKNDYRDAEAIAEAVERENMRFVPIKTEDQLDLQALHRVRDRLVARWTSVINQIRAFLLERGISFRTLGWRRNDPISCGCSTRSMSANRTPTQVERLSRLLPMTRYQPRFLGAFFYLG